MRVIVATILAGATALSAASASAEAGVDANSVLFGQSAAFNGPAAALGTGMRLGIEAAFAEANAAGGVDGRQIDLKTYDDGYEPNRAMENTRKLIDDDQVFALIGAVGTPTSKATQPLATESGVPFVGPFTGAGFLRDGALRNVVNVRATYAAETEAWVERLTKDLGAQRIALLYQDDSFGRAGRSGVLAALEKRGMSLAAEGAYKRNTTAVKTALLDIRKADPDAVAIVGPYKPASTFIRLARRIGLDAQFINISFVGSAALAQELSTEGVGVAVSQVVPLPADASLPLAREYQAALKAFDAAAEPGFVSFEGYIVGRLAIAALSRIDGAPTRGKFLDAIYAGDPFDFGGLTLTFGDGDNQGMDDVFMTVIGFDGRYRAVDTL